MWGVVGRWCVILVMLACIAPGAMDAQEAQGRSANALLPAAESLGAGWVQLSTEDPAELDPAFRDAVTAIYGGPEGARVRISVFVVADGQTADRDSWERANEDFDSYRVGINDGDDGASEQDIDARALPAGCADARRSSGTDLALGESFPVGLTLCDAVPGGLFLVYASGEVGGLTGHAASDQVVELAVSAGTVGRSGAASGTATVGDEAADADQSAVSVPIGVVSHDIYFEPREITIPSNTDVAVLLPNEGVTLHNFAISTLGINIDIPPGDTKEIVINAPAGEYEYICTVPGHWYAGMVGTLIVE